MAPEHAFTEMDFINERSQKLTLPFRLSKYRFLNVNIFGKREKANPLSPESFADSGEKLSDSSWSLSPNVLLI